METEEQRKIREYREWLNREAQRQAAERQRILDKQNSDARQRADQDKWLNQASMRISMQNTNRASGRCNKCGHVNGVSRITCEKCGSTI